MLSAKIKDEPVNQMVPCKSSFAFEEWNEEPCCRDREIFRYQAAVCPAGSGAVPEQQEGLCRISVRFIHSSAGGGTHCRDKCGRCQDLEPSLLTCTCANTIHRFPFCKAR